MTRRKQKVRQCDKEISKALKLRKACGLDGIPNQCLRHLPRRPLVHLTHLFNHSLWLSHSPKPWKEVKVIMLPKSGKDPKFSEKIQSLASQ
jgi:hypothetical protein